MSKNNPFASGQPFREDPAPSGTEQGFRNGASSTSREATVAPALVTAEAWGTEGESFIAHNCRSHSCTSYTVQHLAVPGSSRHLALLDVLKQ